MKQPSCRPFCWAWELDRIPDKPRFLNFRVLLGSVIACIYGMLLKWLNRYLGSRIEMLRRTGTVVSMQPFIHAARLVGPSNRRGSIERTPVLASDQKGQPVLFRHEGAHWR